LANFSKSTRNLPHWSIGQVSRQNRVFRSFLTHKDGRFINHFFNHRDKRDVFRLMVKKAAPCGGQLPSKINYLKSVSNAQANSLVKHRCVVAAYTQTVEKADFIPGIDL